MAKSKEQSPKDRFLSLLKDEILKLDLADLDFGIYRILAHRRKALTDFFDVTLPKRLERALDGTEAENEQLYGLLHNFYRRYYKDGDFEPQPRHGKTGAYLVEYNGEDVHFHWRSRGSHYVKSGEQLQRYAYKDGRWEVELTLVHAVEGKDDQKVGTRFFVPLPDRVTADAPRRKLSIPFTFRPLTPDETKVWGGSRKADPDDGGATTTQGKILDALVPQIALPLDGPTVKKLRQQLDRFTRKERTDYFVHKDLGNFLNTELDRFLQAHLLDPEQFAGADLTQNAAVYTDRLRMLKAARGVGRDINGFLDEIESFQAALFEKKKFVLGTRWLVPMQNVPESLWPTIVQNGAQHAEWKELFALKGAVTTETLRTHPTLVVDTKHFPESFVDALLASFDDVDEATDGLLVHAENYAALTTLRARLAGEVGCVFADPPYNTGSDGFLYKDDFAKHSTWLTLMAPRFRAALDCMRSDGFAWVTLDDIEAHRFRQLLETLVPDRQLLTVSVWQHSIQGKGYGGSITPHHNYVLAFTGRNCPSVGYLDRTEEHNVNYRNPDNDPKGHWRPGDVRNALYRPNLIFPITAPDGSLIEPPEKGWRWSKDTVAQKIASGQIIFSSDNKRIINKIYLCDQEGRVPESIWFGKDVGTTRSANALLKEMFGTNPPFDTPKPIELIARTLALSEQEGTSEWVLDFFAGSGSTGHATLAENRVDGARRKFALVEMSDHFQSAVVPRMKKVTYCPEWKDARPETDTAIGSLLGDKPDWMARTPRLVKVLTLERYEDSLDALTLPETKHQTDAFFDDPTALGYRLADVVAGSPVLLNTALLSDPFAYTLAVTTPEGHRNVPVDLVETWNLLAGLRIRRRRATSGPAGRVLLVEADTREGERVLVVWRATGQLDPKKDREFVSGAVTRELGTELSSYAVVWHNGDSVFGRNARSLDAEFQRLMMQREER